MNRRSSRKMSRVIECLSTSDVDWIASIRSAPWHIVWTSLVVLVAWSAPPDAFKCASWAISAIGVRLISKSSRCTSLSSELDHVVGGFAWHLVIASMSGAFAASGSVASISGLMWQALISSTIFLGLEAGSISRKNLCNATVLGVTPAMISSILMDECGDALDFRMSIASVGNGA